MDNYLIACRVVRFADETTLLSLRYCNKLFKYLVDSRLKDPLLLLQMSKLNLPSDFILDHIEGLNFKDVCKYSKVPLHVLNLDAHDSRVWVVISMFQHLSEEFISSNANKVHWFAISKHQKLSKGFINKYRDVLNAKMIQKYQSVEGDKLHL